MKMRDTDLNHMLTCYHEAGHGVVAHYWGENPRGGIRAIRGERGSCNTTICITPDMIRSAGTDLDREWVTRATKAAVSIYWAGLLTECKYYGFRIPRGGDRPDKFVFVRENGSPYKSIQNIFRKAVEKAGLSNLTPHAMRHTFASRLGEMGCDIRTIQELGRWADIRMVQLSASLFLLRFRGPILPGFLGEVLIPLLGRPRGEAAPGGAILLACPLPEEQAPALGAN